MLQWVQERTRPTLCHEVQVQLPTLQELPLSLRALRSRPTHTVQSFRRKYAPTTRCASSYRPARMPAAWARACRAGANGEVYYRIALVEAISGAAPRFAQIYIKGNECELASRTAFFSGDPLHRAALDALVRKLQRSATARSQRARAVVHLAVDAHARTQAVACAPDLAPACLTFCEDKRAKLVLYRNLKARGRRVPCLSGAEQGLSLSTPCEHLCGRPSAAKGGQCVCAASDAPSCCADTM